MEKKVKIIASNHISNTCRIYIHEVSGENVFYSIVKESTIIKKPKKAKLYCDYESEETEFYFFINKSKFYLNEFLCTYYDVSMIYDTKKDCKKFEHIYE